MSKRMDGALKLLIGYIESGVEVQDAVYKTVEALNLSSTEITRLDRREDFLQRSPSDHSRARLYHSC